MVAVLLALLAVMQDPVPALVEKLGSDDIAVREEASASLIRLGPPALPALFIQVARADEARNAVLKRIVRKIERNEREARLSLPGPRVTLKVKDQPAAGVLAEVSKQAGVEVTDGGLPEGTLLTLDASDLPLADAVDALCKTHGKIAPQWTPGGVHLVPGIPRPLPAFHNGPFSFLPDKVEFAVRKGGASATLRGGVAGPREIFPAAAWIEVQAATDDRGRTWGRNEGQGSEVFRTGNSFSMPLVPDGERVFQPVSWPNQAPPSPDATKLKRIKGFVRLKIVVDWKTAVALANPLANPAAKEGAGTSSLEVTRWSRKDSEVSLSYKATKPAGGPAWKAGEFDRGLPIILEDASGRRAWGRVQRENIVHREGPAGNYWEFDGSTEFTLPEGFEAATLQLLEPEESLQPGIAFELTDVPLK